MYIIYKNCYTENLSDMCCRIMCADIHSCKDKWSRVRQQPLKRYGDNDDE